MIVPRMMIIIITSDNDIVVMIIIVIEDDELSKIRFKLIIYQSLLVKFIHILRTI